MVYAGTAKLADAADFLTAGETCAASSPAPFYIPTIGQRKRRPQVQNGTHGEENGETNLPQVRK